MVSWHAESPSALYVLQAFGNKQLVEAEGLGQSMT